MRPLETRIKQEVLEPGEVTSCQGDSSNRSSPAISCPPPYPNSSITSASSTCEKDNLSRRTSFPSSTTNPSDPTPRVCKIEKNDVQVNISLSFSTLKLFMTKSFYVIKVYIVYVYSISQK